MLHLLSYTDKELTNSLFKAPNWLQNISRQAVMLHLLSYAEKEPTNSLVLASDWLTNISEINLVWKNKIQRNMSQNNQQNSSPFTNPLV